MTRKIVRPLIFLQLIIAITMVIPSLAYTKEIVVKPGKFDHFNVSMPDRIVAGEEASIKIQAVDVFNNLITNFGEIQKEFHVSVSGSAAVKPAVFKSSAFVNGTITIAVTDRIAETVNLSIRESGITIPILSKDLSIVPNKLNAFSIKGPRSAQAGERFDVKIIAKDSFGNTVLEPILGKNLNIIFKGNADPKIDMASIPDFKGGVCTIAVTSQKSGTTTIEAKDLITGSIGTSDKIDITSGPVNSFRMFAPKDVIAGEPFEVDIVAIDRFNNIVTNYATTGGGVTITSSGKLKPFPSTLAAYEFANGQVKIDLRYDIAEDVTLTVTESGKAQKGTTNIIKVVSPIPERYEITTPDSVVAGQKFKLKVTVYNQLSHVIRNYNLVGPDVLLTTTGSGMLVPDKIPASEFINGTAVVEVQYNKSESFAISASPLKPVPMPVAKKPAPAAAKPAVTEPAKVKKAKDEPKKDREKKVKKEKKESKSLEITNVSLVEPKKKSTITIHIPNLDSAVKYNASTETAAGKKWIVIKVKPVINKIDKEVKFDSTFVGSVVVEDDKKEKGAVIVKIEQLKPTRFHVTKEKGSLTVTLKH
ncbi:MAG: hypothetical protein M1147_11165 [Nitrospirae bacterium]|nr:hypothetical protein [Nitrospirota bacterium]MCL5978649.1 hypothetical protein [Nitrospirota bacterium]